MRIVVAQCLAFAWDSVACKSYEPGQGPLEGGRYEIDADSQLSTLTTIRGKWLFQYPGHEGNVPKKDAVPVQATVVLEAPKSDNRKRPMSAEHKKKMIEARAVKRAEKMARLQEIAA